MQAADATPELLPIINCEVGLTYMALTIPQYTCDILVHFAFVLQGKPLGNLISPLMLQFPNKCSQTSKNEIKVFEAAADFNIFVPRPTHSASTEEFQGI